MGQFLPFLYFPVLQIPNKFYILKKDTTWVGGIGNGTLCFTLFYSKQLYLLNNKHILFYNLNQLYYTFNCPH